MLFEHMLWRGLVNRLVQFDMPPYFAMQIAAACYPNGAKKAMRGSGFVFVPPVVSPKQACVAVSRFEAAGRKGSIELFVPLLVVLFGEQRFDQWREELLKADAEAAADDRQQLESRYAAALRELGLPPTASLEDVQKQYKSLCREFHPDRNQHEAEEIQAKRHGQMASINKAYEVAVAWLELARTAPSGRRPTKSAQNHETATGRSNVRPTLAPTTQQGTPASSSPVRSDPPPTLAPTPQQATPASSKPLRPDPTPTVTPTPPQTTPASSSRLRPEPTIARDGGSPAQPSGTRSVLALLGLFALSVVGLIGVVVVQELRKEATPKPQSASKPKTTVATPPRPPVQPTRTASEIRLSHALAKANQEISLADYEEAFQLLRPFLSPRRPADVKDSQLWVSYLQAMTTAFGGKEKASTYQQWQLLNQIGVAWHNLMKEAIASNNLRVAQYAYQQAASQYGQLAAMPIAPSPSLSVQSSNGLSKQESDAYAAEKNKRFLVGIALENIAVLAFHLSAYTGDAQLHREAKAQKDKCLRYHAEQFGENSDEYRQSATELLKYTASSVFQRHVNP